MNTLRYSKATLRNVSNRNPSLTPEQNPLKMQLNILNHVYLLTALSPLSHAALPFGLLGSEGLVLFLNGFHFLSGNSSAESVYSSGSSFLSHYIREFCTRVLLKVTVFGFES